jgi:hypothetical protein
MAAKAINVKKLILISVSSAPDPSGESSTVQGTNGIN